MAGFIGFPEKHSLIKTGAAPAVILSSRGSVQTAFYIVYSITSKGFNDPHVAFIVYLTNSFDGSETANITPLDGKTYKVEDIDYNGVSYRGIKVSGITADKTATYIAIGYSTLNIGLV